MKQKILKNIKIIKNKYMKKKLEATVQVRNYTNKQIKIKTIKMIKSQKKINKMGMIFVTYLKLRILIKDQNLACKLLISTLYKKAMFWNPI